VTALSGGWQSSMFPGMTFPEGSYVELWAPTPEPTPPPTPHNANRLGGGELKSNMYFLNPVDVSASPGA
jgi:hypothetical protein